MAFTTIAKIDEPVAEKRRLKWQAMDISAKNWLAPAPTSTSPPGSPWADYMENLLLDAAAALNVDTKFTLPKLKQQLRIRGGDRLAGKLGTLSKMRNVEVHDLNTLCKEIIICLKEGNTKPKDATATGDRTATKEDDDGHFCEEPLHEPGLEAAHDHGQEAKQATSEGNGGKKLLQENSKHCQRELAQATAEAQINKISDQVYQSIAEMQATIKASLEGNGANTKLDEHEAQLKAISAQINNISTQVSKCVVEVGRSAEVQDELRTGQRLQDRLITESCQHLQDQITRAASGRRQRCFSTAGLAVLLGLSVPFLKHPWRLYIY